MTIDRSHPDSPEGGASLIPPNLPPGMKGYRDFHALTLERREDFWRAQAGRIVWNTPFETVVREDFSVGAVEWFAGGTLKSAWNALDAVIERGGGEKCAIMHFGPEGARRELTYRELADETARFASALAASGFSPGDRFLLYLPDSPETVIALLACARAGIIAAPVPVRYSAELASEIAENSGAAGVLASLGAGSESYEARARALVGSFAGKTVVDAGPKPGGDVLSLERFLARGGTPDDHAVVEAEHPLFILYANSAAGAPRGSVFAAGGFLVQAASSYDWLFRSPVNGEGAQSIVCTLDFASAAGLCYGVWGPLMSGATVVIADEGLQSAAVRLRRVIGACAAPALLTNPTLLDEMRGELAGGPLEEGKFFALIASAGDVLKPRTISFAGRSLTRSPERVLNLWIQTECGAAVIATWPDAELNRSGALGLPFPGVRPLVVNYLGKTCRPNESGQLVFASSWPSMARTIWGQEERYLQMLFRRVPGFYSTNDGARADADDFYWFMGRLDDVIKVRGQSLATSEIESVLVAHPLVTEAAVVSIEAGEGESLVAFIVLEKSAAGQVGESGRASLEAELAGAVERRIGEYAIISRYVFAGDLPHTQTGKIVRRVLKRVALGDISGDEDMSHIANPDSILKLLRERDT